MAQDQSPNEPGEVSSPKSPHNSHLKTCATSKTKETKNDAELTKYLSLREPTTNGPMRRSRKGNVANVCKRMYAINGVAWPYIDIPLGTEVGVEWRRWDSHTAKPSLRRLGMEPGFSLMASMVDNSDDEITETKKKAKNWNKKNFLQAKCDQTWRKKKNAEEPDIPEYRMLKRGMWFESFLLRHEQKNWGKQDLEQQHCQRWKEAFEETLNGYKNEIVKTSLGFEMDRYTVNDWPGDRSNTGEMNGKVDSSFDNVVRLAIKATGINQNATRKNMATLIMRPRTSRSFCVSRKLGQKTSLGSGANSASNSCGTNVCRICVAEATLSKFDKVMKPDGVGVISLALAVSMASFKRDIWSEQDKWKWH